MKKCNENDTYIFEKVTNKNGEILYADIDNFYMNIKKEENDPPVLVNISPIEYSEIRIRYRYAFASFIIKNVSMFNATNNTLIIESENNEIFYFTRVERTYRLSESQLLELLSKAYPLDNATDIIDNYKTVHESNEEDENLHYYSA